LAPATSFGTPTQAGLAPLLPRIKMTADSFIGVNSAVQMPPRVSFEGVRPSVYIPPVPPEPKVFIGFSGTALVPERALFEGARGATELPSVQSRAAFEGITASGALQMPQTKESFSGMSGITHLPPRVSFEGMSGASWLPSKVSFEGAKGNVAIAPSMFEGIRADVQVKVMFPGNRPIAPVQGIGVPLGAEKDLLSPRIKNEGMQSSATLPKAASFEGANGEARLPSQASFEGATGDAEIAPSESNDE